MLVTAELIAMFSRVSGFVALLPMASISEGFFAISNSEMPPGLVAIKVGPADPAMNSIGLTDINF